MWETIKDFFIYMLKWLGLIGMILMTVIILTVFFKETSGIWTLSEADLVEEKYTHKGLYFAQRYFIKMSNGDLHHVFKRDFNALEEGDTFQPTFHSLSWKDFLLITFISGLAFIVFFGTAYFFAFLLFYQKKWFQKLEEKRKQLLAWFLSSMTKSEKTKERWKKASFLTLILLLSIPYLFMAKNVFVKNLPVGKESTIAEIQAREIDKAGGFRGRPSDIYTLTYTFKDENEEIYQTKKDVTYHTYYKYEHTPYIPITYRKRFPYESFIETKSVVEFISPILRFSNISLLVVLCLLSYFIKKYLDMWGLPFVRKGKSG